MLLHVHACTQTTLTVTPRSFSTWHIGKLRHRKVGEGAHDYTMNRGRARIQAGSFASELGHFRAPQYFLDQ